ncbi:Retrovirus-related Pol polyprotein from transposon TNT 1-94 [Abeliophyllum distichum]|uniref:Retrovirus-related Pol polyprotein from transposon TNT 1-94 n=1 Tax=Abeliophyllum distichum TaxID=126358 RepID=A0ABD1RTV9_9LAMI
MWSCPRKKVDKVYLLKEDVEEKTWVYFIKEKFEVFGSFKRFKTLVEKESGLNVEAMRSDRGGELSKECNKFCEENGIRHPLTVPRSHQQNGVVERNNHTILMETHQVEVQAQVQGDHKQGAGNKYKK